MKKKRTDRTPEQAKPPAGRQINVSYLARVEGEGGLHIRVADGQVTDLQLNIFEPPRLFEAFLVGRSYEELPDLTARICGICPVAYQMSAVHAAEDAFGIQVTGQLRQLRRLLYCGEWLESHLLSIYMLGAPDFLGYESVIAMAKDYPEEVRRALSLKRLGNEIVALLGGREIHPVSARVGGFWRVPKREELASLAERLRVGKEDAIRGLQWVAKLPIPDFAEEREFVALSHPGEYAMNEGRIVSSDGLNIAVRQFEDYFVEEQVPYSTALHCSLKGRGAYFVGPLARVNLNFALLSADTKQAATDSGFSFPNANPFVSIVARAIEVVYAMDEALRIIENYERPVPNLPVQPKAGTGYGLTEAPRGMLYHRYDFDESGTVRSARLIPPTAQNQSQIEKDLRAYAPRVIDLPLPDATLRCEMVVRSYDPCISCSTHFLRLSVARD